jgi:hypothetical protein
MKNRKKLIHHFPLWIVLAFTPMAVLAQGASQGKLVTWQVGVEGNLSRLEGDAPAYVRQSALDYATNFGTTTTYSRIWKQGFGIGGAMQVNAPKIIGFEAGIKVTKYSTAERFSVAYNPPITQGLGLSETKFTNSYLSLCPGLGIRLRWKMLALTMGAQANAFLVGKTRREDRTELDNGEVAETATETRLDTQYQPIYPDPLHGGGVANFTHITNRNHGANPIWFSGFARLDYRLVQDRMSPIFGFGWQIPFGEILRSNNPSWSLIPAVDADFQEMNLGTRISTMSLHVGWAF